MYEATSAAGSNSMVEVEFTRGSVLHREHDRPSHLPVVRNGPPGTFVTWADELRVSLPTDQIVAADDHDGRVRATFGGMEFVGVQDGQLVFTRVRELRPEEELSPDRSHRMTLDTAWVTAVIANGIRVWPSTVYKIVPRELWERSAATGEFPGSPVDERDGFIHFSTAAQLPGTATKHFAGLRDLLLVAVAADRVDLRWEPSRGGDLFPHLYRPLPHDAVRWVRKIALAEDGTHIFDAVE